MGHGHSVPWYCRNSVWLGPCEPAVYFGAAGSRIVQLCDTFVGNWLFPGTFICEMIRASLSSCPFVAEKLDHCFVGLVFADYISIWIPCSALDMYADVVVKARFSFLFSTCHCGTSNLYPISHRMVRLAVGVLYELLCFHFGLWFVSGISFLGQRLWRKNQSSEGFELVLGKECVSHCCILFVCFVFCGVK